MNANMISLVPANLAAKLDYQANAIVSKVLFKDQNLNITLFAVAQGQEFSPHTTTRQAIVHIIDGSGEFMLKDKWHQFKANDYFYMPKELVHALKASADFKFVLYLFD